MWILHGAQQFQRASVGMWTERRWQVNITYCSGRTVFSLTCLNPNGFLNPQVPLRISNQVCFGNKSSMIFILYFPLKSNGIYYGNWDPVNSGSPQLSSQHFRSTFKKRGHWVPPVPIWRDDHQPLLSLVKNLKRVFPRMETSSVLYLLRS